MHKLGMLLSGNFQGICQQWECYYYLGIFREYVNNGNAITNSEFSGIYVKTGNFTIRDIFRDYMLLLPNNVIFLTNLKLCLCEKTLFHYHC